MKTVFFLMTFMTSAIYAAPQPPPPPSQNPQVIELAPGSSMQIYPKVFTHVRCGYDGAGGPQNPTNEIIGTMCNCLFVNEGVGVYRYDLVITMFFADGSSKENKVKFDDSLSSCEKARKKNPLCKEE